MDSKTDAVLDAVSLGPNGKASLRHPKKKNLEQVVGRPDGSLGQDQLEDSPLELCF